MLNLWNLLLCTTPECNVSMDQMFFILWGISTEMRKRAIPVSQRIAFTSKRPTHFKENKSKIIFTSRSKEEKMHQFERMWLVNAVMSHLQSYLLPRGKRKYLSQTFPFLDKTNLIHLKFLTLHLGKWLLRSSKIFLFMILYIIIWDKNCFTWSRYSLGTFEKRHCLKLAKVF